MDPGAGTETACEDQNQPAQARLLGEAPTSSLKAHSKTAHCGACGGPRTWRRPAAASSYLSGGTLLWRRRPRARVPKPEGGASGAAGPRPTTHTRRKTQPIPDPSPTIWSTRRRLFPTGERERGGGARVRSRRNLGPRLPAHLNQSQRGLLTPSTHTRVGAAWGGGWAALWRRECTASAPGDSSRPAQQPRDQRAVSWKSLPPAPPAADVATFSGALRPPLGRLLPLSRRSDTTPLRTACQGHTTPAPRGQNRLCRGICHSLERAHSTSYPPHLRNRNASLP